MTVACWRFTGGTAGRGILFNPGNAAFDADLRGRPSWGLREVETVEALAAGNDFGPAIIASMPSDNPMLLFRRFG
jgi:Protein of unknown function (DUF938)